MDKEDIDLYQTKEAVSEKVIICKFGCGTRIKFDNLIKSINGKLIPLNLDGSPHECPLRYLKFTKSQGDTETKANTQDMTNEDKTNFRIDSHQPSIDRLIKEIFKINEKCEYTSKTMDNVQIEISFLKTQFKEMICAIHNLSKNGHNRWSDNEHV